MSGLLLPLRRRPTAAHPQRATVTVRGTTATFTDPADALDALTLPGELGAPAARRYLAEFPPIEAEYLASVRSRGPRIVGLFEGYGGLTMGVQSVLGGTLAAYAEIEPAMVSLLAQRHPGVPNLGDVSTTDWSALRASLLAEYGVEHDGPLAGVVMTGGFPCQDVSLAGLRRGLRDGTRSGLWSEFARGIDTVRPGLVVIENVRGLLSAEADRNMEPGPWDLGRPERGHRPALRALGAVLGDLADLGYDARWCGVRAADAGAPHARYRVFVIARPADPGDLRLGGEPTAHDHDWSIASGDDTHRRAATHGDGVVAAEEHAIADLVDRERAQDGRRAVEPAGPRGDRVAAGRREAGEPASGRAATAGIAAHPRGAAADAERDRGERRGGHGDVASPTGTREADRGERERDGDAPDDRGTAARTWGPYAPAIEQWEARLGRVAPAPTNPDGKGGAHRLAPQFVEWMMGLPQGHVTDPTLGLTRAQQLKALGNGVVPQQAALAVAALLPAEAVAA